MEKRNCFRRAPKSDLTWEQWPQRGERRLLNPGTPEKVRARAQGSHHVQSGQAPSHNSPGLSGNLGIPLDREVEVLPGHCHPGVSCNKVTTRPQLSTMSLRYLKRSLSLSFLPNKGLPDSRSSKMLKTQVPKSLPKSPSQRLSWRSSGKLHPGVLSSRLHGNQSSGLPGALCKGLQTPLTTKEKPKFCRGEGLDSKAPGKISLPRPNHPTLRPAPSSFGRCSDRA